MKPWAITKTYSIPKSEFLDLLGISDNERIKEITIGPSSIVIVTDEVNPK